MRPAPMPACRSVQDPSATSCPANYGRTMEPRIDGDAFFADLDRLNRFGLSGGPGVSGVAFSPADMEGRAFLEGRLRELGMAVERDPAGNTVGRLEGAD